MGDTDKKILIIDDSKNDRQIMDRRLKKVGYTNLHFSETAQDGIIKVQSLKPDIVVLDIMLPDEKGTIVCTKIKSIEGLNTKVILVTSYHDILETDEVKSCAADGAVAKSETYEALIKAIDILKNQE